MTETSDSGFTEINQSRSSDNSQCDKSGNTSPALNTMDESNSQAANSDLIMSAGGRNIQDCKGEESNTNSDSMRSSSSSSEDSDDDYEDSEQDGKKSVFSWVSVKVNESVHCILK